MRVTTNKPQYRLVHTKNTTKYKLMVMVMLLSGMQLQKNRRFEQKRVTFMKQVEKDQRSSNEFSMRLEITASFFSDAA